MIDEERTLEEYGYVSTDLSPCSRHEVILVCDWCGLEYIRPKSRMGKGRFCSNECVGKYNSSTRMGENHPMWKDSKCLYICEWCGAEFSAYPQNKRRFCSVECGVLASKGAYTGEDSPNWHGGMVSCICEFCGAEYFVNRARSEVSRFCSHACADAWIVGKRRGKESPNWKGGNVVCICAVCGRSYEVRRSRELITKCCSVECRYIRAASLMEGENNPSWKGGISFVGYSSEFNDEFKEIVRERFGRECFVCGMSEELNGKMLDVHHSNYDKTSVCDDEDCIFVPLCRKCHMRTNHNRLFWERTITYALGYYDEYYRVEIPKPLLRLNI